MSEDDALVSTESCSPACDPAARVAELESLIHAQADRIAAQSELLSKVAELLAALAPITGFVRRVELSRIALPDTTPVLLWANPIAGQCCSLGDLRRLAALAGIPRVAVGGEVTRATD